MATPFKSPARTGTDPSVVLEAVAEVNLEGIVCKQLDSPYKPGIRSPDWIKIPSVVVNFDRPSFPLLKSHITVRDVCRARGRVRRCLERVDDRNGQVFSALDPPLRKPSTT